MPDEPGTDSLLTPSEFAVGELLDRHRAVPGADFRGALGRRLVALDPGWGPRPARLLLIATGYVAPGLVLIGIGALIGTGAL